MSPEIKADPSAELEAMTKRALAAEANAKRLSARLDALAFVHEPRFAREAMDMERAHLESRIRDLEEALRLAHGNGWERDAQRRIVAQHAAACDATVQRARGDALLILDAIAEALDHVREWHWSHDSRGSISSCESCGWNSRSDPEADGGGLSHKAGCKLSAAIQRIDAWLERAGR